MDTFWNKYVHESFAFAEVLVFQIQIIQTFLSYNFLSQIMISAKYPYEASLHYIFCTGILFCVQSKIITDLKLNNILFFLDFFLPISLFRFQHNIKLKIFFIVLHTFLPTSMTSKKTTNKKHLSFLLLPLLIIFSSAKSSDIKTFATKHNCKYTPLRTKSHQKIRLLSYHTHNGIRKHEYIYVYKNQFTHSPLSPMPFSHSP